MVPINFAAVLIAAVIGMAWGFLWYGPLFGRQWLKLMGINSADLEKKKQGMAKNYAITFVGTIVMSFVLAHALLFATTYLQIYGVVGGMMGAFWNWLGFIAPVTLGTVLWDGRSWRLWCLNNGYWLSLLMIMSAALSLWK